MKIIRFILIIIIMTSTSYLMAELKNSKGVTQLAVMSNGSPMNIWYQLPENMANDTPIVFVMHGVLRNADEYRDAWIDLAKQYQFIVVVPEFDNQAFPGTASYNLGNLLDNEGNPNSRDKWSFSVINRIFQQMKTVLNNDTEKFYIFGHSAGSQFVHRLVLFNPELPIALAIAANAGWYTLPTNEQQFPYGIQGSGVNAIDLTKFISASMVILLGDKDTDPNDQYLRTTVEANLQGAHRFERGKNYYKLVKDTADAMAIPFNWQLVVAPDIGHENSLMAPFAAKLIADHMKRNTD